MMRNPLILITIFFILFTCSIQRANAQVTLIPDPNFEQELITMGVDTAPINGSVPTANISGVTILAISYKNIHDLTGIRDFTSLRELYCSGNSLTSLDVSANTALIIVMCNFNQLTGLNVTHCPVLSTLICNNNQIAGLDLSYNTAMIELDCAYNKLPALDVTKCAGLLTLSCYANLIPALDVTKNILLTELKCGNNKLPSLDVTKNTALLNLSCSTNLLPVLDVTKNTALMSLDCGSNKLPSLDVTKNTALIDLICRFNLLPILDITKNTALMDLDCEGNKLPVLDLTKNTALQSVNCGNNQIPVLDLAKNTALMGFWCNVNLFANLDVTKNTALVNLSCASNPLITLDLTKNINLGGLTCYSTLLTGLDVTKNTALNYLSCFGNTKLRSLNLKNGFNPLLMYMDARGNPNLACIQVDNAALAATYINWHKDAIAQYDEFCAPTISSFTPGSNCSGPSIDITGTNLNVATAVSFGGVPAASFSIVSATKITAVVGAGASGNINVITPNGTASIPGFIFYSSTPIAAVNLGSTNSTICNGTNATFTAIATNGGSTPGYQWRVNGSPVGTNAPTYTTSSLANGDVVEVLMASGLGCVTGSPATSNSIVMNVSPIVTPAISIVADKTTICPGTGVNFTAAAINGGTNPVYQWQVNGGNTGTNNPVFVTNALNNGDLVKCIITNNNPCVTVASATSNVIQVTVNSNTAPSLSILASANDICRTTAVTFAATALNAGATSSYQWKLNGLNAGANSPIYVNNNFTNGDKVNCVLNTATSCLGTAFAQSPTIIMIVKPNPVISFDPPAPKMAVGNSVQLNATVSGNPLHYLWTPAAGLNNASIVNPVAAPATTTAYNLHVTEANGCTADKTLTVVVFKSVFIPNSFVPGGHAPNDIFRIPPGTSLALQYFIIYDRYGNEVFETADIGKGWDGTYKGRKSPQGNYVYIIKGSDYSGEVFLRGSVLLIR